jgi:hypothetical protein
VHSSPTPRGGSAPAAVPLTAAITGASKRARSAMPRDIEIKLDITCIPLFIIEYIPTI